MITSLLFLLATAVTPATQPASQADGAPIRENGDGLVALALVADRTAILPGETFALGVRLRIEPGWHVYWENPGDSGLATTATIEAPPGFEVGPLRYPAPERHELEGAIVSYILHGDLLLVADVVAPADLGASSKARFEVESRWLVCTEVCFAGSGSAALELDVALAGAPAKPANEALFKAARTRMPRPWSEIAASASVTRTGDEANPQLKVRVMRATALEFFPAPSATTTLVERKAQVGDAGGTIEIAWRFEGREPGDRPETRGVLHVRTAAGDAFYSFDPSVPAAASTPGSAQKR